MQNLKASELMAEIYRMTLRLNKTTYEKILNISKKNGESISEVTRNLIDKGLAIEVSSKEMDLIAKIIREQLSVILNPAVERLAALSAKGALMSAISTFLNVQALLDIVDKSKRKDVLDFYDKAREKGLEFMKGNEGTNMLNYVKILQREYEAKENLNKKTF